MIDDWRLATVAAIREVTASARTLVLDVTGWPGHLAGQHVKVRLLPGEGDRTERTFSITSPPEQRTVELTIERLPAGEVSSVLCGHDMNVGYQFEISGPRGSFVWRAEDGGPLMLVAGGSGIAPLMAILRHRRNRSRQQHGVAARHRGRTSSVFIPKLGSGDLSRGAGADGPDGRDAGGDARADTPATAGLAGLDRRIDRVMLREVAWSPADSPRIFICGPAAMVAESASALVGLGHDPAMIFTERFGPTSGKSRAA